LNQPRRRARGQIADGVDDEEDDDDDEEDDDDDDDAGEASPRGDK